MLDTLAPRVRLWAGIATLVVAGCSGGAEAPDLNEGGAGDSQPTTGDTGAGGDGGTSGDGGGGVTIGAATLTTDPGTAWAEVDGGRLEYAASGGVAYECTIADDRVIVNFQTADGHDLLVQGAPQGGTWILNLNFRPGQGDDVGYGTTSTRGDGTFGIGGGALSYEGSVDRIEGVDIANATKVDAKVAVNCAPAGGGDSAGGGGDPTATIGGQAYEFALSGAQSVTCEVAPEGVTVRINRLALDNTQLEIDGRQDGDRWIGAVVVYTADGQYVSPFPQDGTGLTISGSSVDYAGTFKAPDGSELDGTAAATCP
jgi:hypothetical protein